MQTTETIPMVCIYCGERDVRPIPADPSYMIPCPSERRGGRPCAGRMTADVGQGG